MIPLIDLVDSKASKPASKKGLQCICHMFNVTSANSNMVNSRLYCDHSCKTYYITVNGGFSPYCRDLSAMSPISTLPAFRLSRNPLLHVKPPFDPFVKECCHNMFPMHRHCYASRPMTASAF